MKAKVFPNAGQVMMVNGNYNELDRTHSKVKDMRLAGIGEVKNKLVLIFADRPIGADLNAVSDWAMQETGDRHMSIGTF